MRRKMKSREIKRQRFYVDFYNQWPDLFTSGNWTNFTVITLKGEYAPYMGNFEVVIGLLGLNWTFTYRYDFGPIDELNNIKDQILKDLEAEHPGLKVHDPLGVLDDLESMVEKGNN